MENEKLQAYLEAFRSEGELDSEGCFTLDRQKAVGKIAQYLLPDEGAWALKVVQSACRLQARELRIKELRAYSSFSIRLVEPLGVRSLRENLLGTGEDYASLPLCQAVRYVSSTQKRLVTIVLTQGRDRTTFLINADEVIETISELPKPEPPSLQLLVSRNHETSQLFQLSGEAFRFASKYLDTYRSPEFERLHQHARACPIRLTLNGNRIDDLNVPWTSQGADRVYFVGALFAESREQENNVVRVPQAVSRSGHSGLLPGTHGPLACQRFDGLSKVGCLLGVHYATSGSKVAYLTSRIHLLKDGVIVDTAYTDFSGPIGFDLVISNEEIPTDLSGLKADLPAKISNSFTGYLPQFRAPLQSLTTYLAGSTPWNSKGGTPNDFEGLEFASKLRMFAAGSLKSRGGAAHHLAQVLARKPFNVPEVGGYRQ